MRALVEGFPVAESGWLPLFGTVEVETALTMPAAFQLLPHRGSQEFYDGALRPLPADLYEVETWSRFGWSIFDPAYRAALTKRMRKAHGAGWRTQLDNLLAEREAYLKVVLGRARLFAEALNERGEGVPVRNRLQAAVIAAARRAPGCSPVVK